MKPGQLIDDLICTEEAKKEKEHGTESECLQTDTIDDDDGQEPLDDLQQQDADETGLSSVRSFSLMN